MRLHSILATALLVAAAAPATAQIAPPPIEAYGELPLFSDAELSPDGSRIATIANLPSGPRIVVLGRDGKVIRQIGVEDIKPRDIQFFDNNHVIALLSKTTQTYGFAGRYEASGAFAINVEGGAPVGLLKRTDGLFPAQTGLGRIIGRADEPGRVLMPAFMGESHQSPKFDLLHVDLKDGRGGIEMKGTADTIDWFADATGKVIARERYNNSRDVYEIEIRSGNSWTSIYKREDAETLPFTITGLMPDGSGLIYVASGDGEVHDGLMVLGFDGKVSGPILGRRGKEIESIYTDDARRVLGVRYTGMLPDYEFLDPGLKANFESFSARFPDATIYIDSWSDDRRAVLYNMFDPSLGDVWIVNDVDKPQPELIAKNRKAISADQTGMIVTIEYKARDGLTIPAVVTLPPGADIQDNIKRPLIVMPHGGPATYDRVDFDWMAQFVASRGYVVLQPNFRGSSGFGEEFEDAGRGEWGGKMQHDLTDGVAALSQIGMIDPAQVCIVGASYGGYAALAGAAFTPEVYRCSAAIAPVADLSAMLSEERMRYGRDHWVISYWEGIMADGDARRQRLKDASPINAADRVRAPVLLIHGEDDTVVPISQSERMERALKRAGKPVEFVRLKGEDHWMSVPETRLQMLTALEAFLKIHLPVAPAVNEVGREAR
ncbi:MAG: S9 family peptidase [Hyphomonas sp.]|uniref:alpha/beta hydrolase family protein n=1 Tax=Hyphomonas sp. TaxID=87 RepID=UPI0017A99345|nr:alpha/beta fold hydrolase [Hyphomonas sp.]MBA3067051.1 S9 family peptidase [Hyphomonas sp.]MBU3921133.1 prolyl oligopeptidase family serine peptidase [Alphaproteobacteria bacterium]MBU4063154.1 prolyl oligopeptidase family serine peptidase [Alphaproteobacteria bacterium]MBU4164471.1 prolyl oligopeptidase family serine peptidase [Alphaproteobacteria bacterium]